MEPDNPEYRGVLNQLQNGGQAYRQRSQGYGMPTVNLGNICLGVILTNLFCTFCRPFVITSYSIHYTKLYETACAATSAGPSCRAIRPRSASTAGRRSASPRRTTRRRGSGRRPIPASSFAGRRPSYGSTRPSAASARPAAGRIRSIATGSIRARTGYRCSCRLARPDAARGRSP